MKAILRTIPVILLGLAVGCGELPTDAPAADAALLAKGGNKPPKDPPGGGDGSVADPAIAFVHDGTLRVMNADGSMNTALVDGVSRGVSWSPSATRIAFAPGGSGSTNTIMIADLALANGVPIVTGTTDLVLPHPGTPAWSPLGDLIAYAGGCDPGEPDGTCGEWGYLNHLRVVPAAGGEAHTLYEAPGCADPWACLISGTPAWSPDGSQIAFVEGRGEWWSVHALRVVDVASAPTQVSQTLIAPGQLASICDPDWSPDGSRIAFWGHEASTSPTTLFVLDLATGTWMNVGLEAATHCADVSWSPDGTQWVVDTGDAVRLVDVASGQVIPRSKSKLASGVSPDWRSCEAGEGCGLAP
jgi:Tol biopolymer transport system component